MGSKWLVVRLGNHCLKIGSGATPKGGSSVYSDSGSIWRFSLYVLVNIFIPPDNHDFASSRRCSFTLNQAK